MFQVLEVWLPDFAYDEAIEIPLHSKVKKILSPQPGPSGVKSSKKRKTSSAEDESDSKRKHKNKKNKKKKKKHKKSKKANHSDDSDFDSDSDEEASLSPGEQLDLLDEIEEQLRRKKAKERKLKLLNK